MYMRVFASLLISAVAGIGLFPAFAGTPVKTSEVAPAEDLAAEAQAKLTLLGSYIENEKNYVKAQENNAIAQAAGVLACLAQAIAEYDKKSDLKVAAPELRDAAILIRDSKSMVGAKKGLDIAKQAWDGKSPGQAKAAYDWNKLIDFDLSMEEVEARNNQIRRLVRRPKNPQQDSLHATTLAVLALAIHASSDVVPKVKNKEDVKKWQGFAVEYQERMTAVATAFKKKNAAEAKRQWLSGAKACNACHLAFQEK